jgi:tRNA(fMet)-specific endonuclease VapC
MDKEGDCRRFLRDFTVLFPDEETAWRASRIVWQLKDDGGRIGDHDVWIAATALEHNLPLVTRNLRHFQRVNGPRILAF